MAMENTDMIVTRNSLEGARGSSLSRLSAKQKASETAIDKAAEDFEAMFLSEMLSHMFTDSTADEVTGGGHAEEVYRSFLNDEYAKLMARSGGVGVSDYVKREMLKLQEV